jgi:glutaredoxin/glutathione-dependent peroxiredoxin
MTIKVKDSIPSVNIKTVIKGEMADANTAELFGNGKTVLFGVPGAFTPTCSQAHLPGFVVHADTIKAKGVDRIVCMSVNDAFVMKAWGEASNASELVMLADGNAEFTKALGLVMDGTGFGMGTRCVRFAMLIENGKVTDVFVEKPKEFEVSKAEYILEKL